MNFDHSDKTLQLIATLNAFMDRYIYPVEKEHDAWVIAPENAFKPWPGMDTLKEEAKKQGLWNLFLPHEYGHFSPGLSNLEYAALAEIMGRAYWASEVFNCSAPDTGNMEVLAKFGNSEQQEQWLLPLLDGSIRSAFAMTEPGVASSDATTLELSITRDGESYVVNGRKWWTSGIMDPRCSILIVMGKTDTTAPRHLQHSMILVPRDTPGVQVIRHLPVFSGINSPGGEAEVLFDNVRVPVGNLLLGEGRGFEIAQGRLGPGRIHHCMRCIGQAQRALELAAKRASERFAFGRLLAEQGGLRQEIARSYCDIEQARLLTLKAADAIDKRGPKGARDLIAAIKIVAPQMAQTVADRAIQIHGAMGVSHDTPLAHFFTLARSLRIADGPDEVHLNQLGKLKIAEYT